MKKLFLLLTAITSMGYATTTMNFETGLSGNLMKAEKGKIPVSVSAKFKEFGFTLEGKLSNSLGLNYKTAAATISNPTTTTLANVKVGYDSEKFSKTKWNFEMDSSSKLDGSEFTTTIKTGFSHELGLVDLSEGLQYVVETTKANKLLGNFGVRVAMAKLYVESGYDFQTKDIILNGKVSAEFSKGMFTYSPYIKTDAVFSKADKFKSANTEVDVVALTFKKDALKAGLKAKVFFNVKETKANLDFGVDSKLELAYDIKPNDKLTLTPAFDLGFAVEGKTAGYTKLTVITSGTADKVNFLISPVAKFNVKHVVSDKITLDYKFKSEVPVRFDTTGYQAVDKAELSFGFGATYTF